MSPETLLEELARAGVWISLHEDRLRVEGTCAPMHLARIHAREDELRDLLRRQEVEWVEAEKTSYAEYVAAMARYHGYDEAAVEQARRILLGVPRVRHFQVGPESTEIEVADGVVIRLRKPPAYACPHYEPLPGVKRCKSYDDGMCKRDDEFVCVEWLRVNHA